MDDQRSWYEKSRERAIDSISRALQEAGAAGMTDLRQAAELIYTRAGRDVMEARKAEMGEADR